MAVPQVPRSIEKKTGGLSPTARRGLSAIAKARPEIGHGPAGLQSASLSSCQLQLERASAPTRSSRSSARAGWARSIGRATRGSAARWRSRSCRRRSPPTPSACGASSRRRKAAGLLNHPNITAVHDIGTQDGAPYVVTELLEGETLREVLSGGRLSPRKAIDYAVQIAQGLAAAHEKGIVHRDLKPENIFVDPRRPGEDPGLRPGQADDHGRRGLADQTFPPRRPAPRPGVVLGTLGYMSPEQVRGKPADARTDIFAFGAILYEMLSGKRAFHGDSAADTMSAILREDPPELSLHEPEHSPAGLERIVRHCLEKNPEQRFHSAHDLAFDLEALSDVSIPGAARSLCRPTRQETMGPSGGLVAGARRRRRRPTCWARDGERVQEGRRRLFAADLPPAAHLQRAFLAGRQDHRLQHGPWGNTPEIFTVRPDFPGAVPPGAQRMRICFPSRRRGELAVLTRPRFNNHALFWGTLARMPLEGAAPREIRNDVREADWSPDGTDLALIRDAGGKDTLEFPAGKVLRDDRRLFERSALLAAGRSHRVLRAPVRYDNRGGSWRWWTWPGNKKVLSDGYWGLEGLAWSPSGDEILFSARNRLQRLQGLCRRPRRQAPRGAQGAGGLTIQDVRAGGGGSSRATTACGRCRP